MSQIFKPSTNTLARVTLFGAIFFLLVSVWILVSLNRSAYATRQTIIRAQPVPFSHESESSSGDAPSSATSVTLLRRLSEMDDHEAWNAFVDRYAPRIFSWCRRYQLQDSDAADVTQEVLRKLIEAMRRTTCGALDSGAKPPVITAMAKLMSTELFRESINDGMDVVGGNGISRGPRNLLAHGYMATPISITEARNLPGMRLLLLQGLPDGRNQLVDFDVDPYDAFQLVRIVVKWAGNGDAWFFGCEKYIWIGPDDLFFIECFLVPRPIAWIVLVMGIG